MAQSQDAIINLEKFIESGLDEILGKALLKTGAFVEGEAKKKCPVDDGQLRQSITHQLETPTKVVIGSAVEYAPYVEIGTGIYSTEGNGRKTPWTYYDAKNDRFIRTNGNEAQPFLEPAVDENKSKIMKFFEGII